jgi:hypothetical protein
MMILLAVILTKTAPATWNPVVVAGTVGPILTISQLRYLPRYYYL